jgi:hypothetical protein
MVQPSEPGHKQNQKPVAVALRNRADFKDGSTAIMQAAATRLLFEGLFSVRHRFQSLRSPRC